MAIRAARFSSAALDDTLRSAASVITGTRRSASEAEADSGREDVTMRSWYARNRVAFLPASGRGRAAARRHDTGQHARNRRGTRTAERRTGNVERGNVERGTWNATIT